MRPVPNPDVLDFQQQNAVFTGMAADSPAIAPVQGRDQSCMTLDGVSAFNPLAWSCAAAAQ